MSSINKDLKAKVEKIVRTVIDITKEQEPVINYEYILRRLPIDSLDEVRSALKKKLGKKYKRLYIRYRGPRPKFRYQPTEENLLKIIALGGDNHRAKYQRALGCLKHHATHYVIYKKGDHLFQ
jgi:hypothetical protein